LGKGTLTSKLNITVTGASKNAAVAVEKLGGILKTSNLAD
jgi:ribosomal protein L15